MKLEISDEQFKELAEANGYVKQEPEYRRKVVEPKTYEGLTEVQWEQVINEDLLCEFWDDNQGRGYVSCLCEFQAGRVYPYGSDDVAFKHCRIHRTQPQFVIDGKKPDWLDDDTQVFIPDLRGIRMARSVNWAKIKRFQVVAL